MPESPFEWLSTRIPIWAFMLAVMGTAGIGLKSLGGIGLDDHGPQLALLEQRMKEHEAEDAVMRAQLAGKVDTTTRLEMLANLTREREVFEKNMIQLWATHGRDLETAKAELARRLDAVERHLEQTDARIERMRDQMRPTTPGVQ